MKIISRAEATALGLKRYFTGKPCVRGHIAERVCPSGFCIDCRPLLNQKWRADNAEKEHERHVRRRSENRDKMRAANQKWRQANPDKAKASRAASYARNKDKEHARRREHYRENPEFRCAMAMRNYVKRTFRAAKAEKDSKGFKVIGYSPAELRAHLEKQFKRGMTWDNHGEWHIDHIIPIKAMIERGIRDPAVVNALSNLMPVWATANKQKSAKVLTLL